MDITKYTWFFYIVGFYYKELEAVMNVKIKWVDDVMIVGESEAAIV